MSLRSAIDSIINFTIKVISFWFFMNIYIFIQFIFNTIGIFGVLFDFQFFGTDIIGGILRVILSFATIYITLVLSVLFWIFVFWMIIKLFVPHIIIVPIPFIPFIIPIPLKNLMLDLIPPFKVMTERGILPLIERIFYRFISNETIKNKFVYSFQDVNRFLYNEIKDTIGSINKLINYKQPDKPPESNYKIDTIDHNTDNDIKAKEEYEKTDNKRVMELINQELEICMKSKQSFTTPESSIFNGITDLNNYSECYSRSIRDYINNKL